MIKQSLELLGQIIKEKSTREQRSTSLLKQPSDQHDNGWHMFLPSCFNEALDIKLTERVQKKKTVTIWTQGSSFSFKAGDTIYDTHYAREVWTESLKRFNLCVHVDAAAAAFTPKGSAGRSIGTVAFSVFTPNEERNKLVLRSVHTMSQDDFVKFLIAGPSEEI